MTSITNFADIGTAMKANLEQALADGKPISVEEAEAKAMEEFLTHNRPHHQVPVQVIDEWVTATHALADSLFEDPLFSYMEKDGEMVHVTTEQRQPASHFFLNKVIWSMTSQAEYWENRLSENTNLLKQLAEAENQTEIWYQRVERATNFGELAEAQVTFWRELADKVEQVYEIVHDRPYGNSRVGKPSKDAMKAVGAALNAILARRNAA